jgi:2-keto-3-deoxy-L-rhamnonate aldolase RhmA
MNLANFETMDPVMLMSIVNMKLRDDFGGDLDKLVNYFDISKPALIEKLASAGFDFLEEAGQFR